MTDTLSIAAPKQLLAGASPWNLNVVLSDVAVNMNDLFVQFISISLGLEILYVAVVMSKLKSSDPVILSILSPSGLTDILPSFIEYVLSSLVKLLPDKQ